MKALPLPETMRALVLTAFDGRPESLRVETRPVPRPTARQVLVRMAASPINPSDMMFIRGMYGTRKPLPMVPGFEGSGTVVAAGGVTGRLMVGRRVACAAPADGEGLWSEYAVVGLSQCLPLRAHISDEQGSSLFVNPFTAWVLMERARAGKHAALAQTAAASALGRMLGVLARKAGIPMVHVVSRPEQVELLRKLGAEHVLSSHEPEFEERLRLMCQELQVSLAFDAVGGRLTGQLSQALVDGGTVIVHGLLSEQECRVHPRDFIFGDKKVEGFWMERWGKRGFGKEKLGAAMAVTAMVGRELQTPVRARLPLESAGEAVRIASSDMTAGKVLFVPGQGSAA
ncbi:zinc-binding dehydrogenase [Pyxidicoccus xibeiensis]|uniref:zinc-binding dehydrogenase n=1 Tax=Pyxidicoccus xibeiensis TaxID=2906759 RepID=UPI0020A817E4|nr:zinc-binding dehydrogenase [Pyxidicoccus xibeiensis]MCP3141325.1 zinc-binding dehydrogenase [Pyxidicoccus xibeiensis]